jgi:hypothetical protein
MINGINQKSRKVINGINQKARKIINPETKNLLQLHFGGDNVMFLGPLSWTIIFGLSFATFLTLIFFPAMCLITEKMTKLILYHGLARLVGGIRISWSEGYY